VTSFQTSAAVLGGLLIVGSLLSGLARRSVLSLAALFVLAGFVLGQGATGVLNFRASSGLVFLLRMRRIFALRRSALILSIAA